MIYLLLGWLLVTLAPLPVAWWRCRRFDRHADAALDLVAEPELPAEDRAWLELVHAYYALPEYIRPTTQEDHR